MKSKARPPEKDEPLVRKKWPRIEDMTREQMWEQSHENIRIMRKMLGLDPDYVPPEPVTIMGILSHLSEPGDDSVEMVKRARAM